MSKENQHLKEVPPVILLFLDHPEKYLEIFESLTDEEAGGLIKNIINNTEPRSSLWVDTKDLDELIKSYLTTLEFFKSNTERYE